MSIALSYDNPIAMASYILLQCAARLLIGTCCIRPDIELIMINNDT